MPYTWVLGTMVLACVCACVRADIRNCGDPVTSQPYRFFSTRTSYDVARGRQLKLENMPGCKPRLLYMLIRHGTRYPGPDEIEAMQDHLPGLRAALIRQGPNSTVCQQNIDQLKNWRLRFRVADALEITERGLQEMYHIGRRMRYRFPAVYAKVREDISRLDLRYSENYRNAVSAKYFAMGLLDQDIQKPGLFPDDIGYAVPRDDDRLLLYCDLCHKYIMQRINEQGPEKSQTLIFNQGEQFKEILSSMNRDLHLGSNSSWDLSLLNTVMEACRFGYAVYGDATWCDILPLEAIKALEYRQDMKYYWRYGHGRDVNYRPACNLVKDVLDNMRISVENGSSPYHAVMRFGHSRTILPFLVRLGLFNESSSLLAENYAGHQKRGWQLGRVNPFSSNLALALYTCSGDEPRVRAFLNEHELRLPGCEDSFCRLSELEKAWGHVISDCDFDDICDSAAAEGILAGGLDALRRDLHHA